MIQDRLDNITAKVQDAQNIPDSTRTELLNLLAGLKSEIAALSQTHDEDARSIARFTDVSTHEATRVEKKPQLVNAALQGLTSSVEGFETSHPALTQTVNRLAVLLSNMGI